MANQGMETLAVMQKSRVTLWGLYLQSDLYRVMIQVFLQSGTVVGFQKKKTQMSTLIICLPHTGRGSLLKFKSLEGRKAFMFTENTADTVSYNLL